jgi:hypothetical protein
MKRLASVILLAGAIVLVAAAPDDAMPRHEFSGGRPGGHFDGHHRFDGQHRFDGHRDFRRDHVRIFAAPLFLPVPFFAAPAFVYAAPPAYWYYCRSYGAYYPYVPSCPEPWVPVPAQ